MRDTVYTLFQQKVQQRFGCIQGYTPQLDGTAVYGVSERIYIYNPDTDHSPDGNDPRLSLHSLLSRMLEHEDLFPHQQALLLEWTGSYCTLICKGGVASS